MCHFGEKIAQFQHQYKGNTIYCHFTFVTVKQLPSLILVS